MNFYQLIHDAPLFNKKKGIKLKFLLFMKLTAILIFAICLQVSANGFSQTVTIIEKNAPLEKVFGIIEKQTGFTFYYKIELMRMSKKVDITLSNASLEKTLETVFKEQPLTYSIIDKNIVVRVKEKRAKLEQTLEQAPIQDIKGSVVNEKGVWITNATVIVKRTGKGTSANERGEFTLKAIEADDILVISAIGYQTAEIPVNNRKFLYIELKIAENKLDEVVIRPYGQSTSRRYNTGSTSKVNAEEIQKQPVTNILDALKGLVPGLTIAQSSGISGSDVFINVRGINSLNANRYTAAPLVVVDGVPFPSNPINNPGKNGSSTTDDPNEILGYGSPLYSLSPSDIESVEILKDADATAIYGSRAANGVILITTKRGKQGSSQLSVTANMGVALNTNNTRMLNTDEYRALRREAFANSGIVPTAINAPDLLKWDSTINTNWQKELIKNTAKTTDVNMSFSGGQGGTSYLVSGNFHDENTVFIDRRKSYKGGAHFAINNVSPNGKFSIGLTGLISFFNNTLPGGNFASSAFSLPPNWTPYDDSGNLRWDVGGGSPYNPYASLMQKYSSKGLTFTSNVDIKYTILPGLNAKAAFGYTRLEIDEHTIRPKASLSPAVVGTIAGQHIVSLSTQNTLNFEPQLQYYKTLGKGTLEVLAGATIMKDVYQQPFYVNATNFTSDAFIENWQLASNYTELSLGYNAYQYASVFSRVSYNYNNKYIVNGSYRRDGSSKFGPGNRYGNFGAIGAAWLFSNEKLLSNGSILSFGKLRGSFGWVGSDNVQNYAFLPLYQKASFPYNSSTGLIPDRLANPDFQWESTTKLEGALELGFFKDRILLTASYYRNRTGNQLVAYDISGQSGFTTYAANLNAAKVQNSGWEFDLTTQNIQKKDFRWSTGFNLSLQRNKLLRFDNIENTPYAANFVVGDPLSSNYLLHYTGINEKGVPQYEDANGDGKVDLGGNGIAVYGKGDRKFAGTTLPDFFGGLTNSLSYKGFQLDFIFQFVKGQKRFGYLTDINNFGGPNNVPKKAVDDIRAAGLAKSIIRTGLNINWFYYQRFSDANIKDASFIRLNNVALSYNFQSKALKALKLGAARVFVQAQNLFVISNFDGFDPESGAVSIPPLLRIVGGFQVTL